MPKERSPIMIKKSREDLLRKQAAREGGLKSDGKISVAWMNKKLSNPRTSKAVKRRVQFAKNALGFKNR